MDPVAAVTSNSLVSAEAIEAVEANANAASADTAAAAAAQSAGGSDVGTTVDPLWGVPA